MMWTPGGQIDHLSFSGLRSGGKGGSKTSSSSGTTTSSSSTQIPDWLSAQSAEAVAMAQDIATQPQSNALYTGQMVADVPTATQQAYQDVWNMQGMTDPAYNTANSIYSGLLSGAQLETPDAQNAITNSLYGNYASNVISPAESYLSSAYSNAANLDLESLGYGQSLLSPYMSQGPATAQNVASNAQQLMSPYTGAVIAPTLALGQQTLAQNLQSIGAAANQAGAYGGSRQGIEEGVAQAQSALGSEQYLGNLLNTQWGNALSTGTSIAEQGAQEGYGAAGLLAGQAGTAAQNLGSFGQTAASALAQMLEGGYNTSQAAAQSMQNTNLQTGLTATNALTTNAQNQANEAAKEAAMMQSIGTSQENQQQNELNAAYDNWVNYQEDPYNKLDAWLSAISSVPYGTTTSGTSSSTGKTTTTTNPSWASDITQTVGAGATLAGLL